MEEEAKIIMPRMDSGSHLHRVSVDVPLPSELNALSFLSKEAAIANIPFPDAWSIAETIASKLEAISRAAGDHPNRHTYGGF